MKKFLKIFFAVALVVSMVLPHCERVSAAETSGKVYAADAEREGLSDSGEKSDHALYDEYYGYVSPKSDGNGKIIFTVDVSTAGKYEIGVVYAAKEGSAARKIGLSVNGAAASLVNLACAADWDTIMTHTITANLVPGQNTVVVSTPADFDDNTVKTPNIYAVTYELKEAALNDADASEDAGAVEDTGAPEDAGTPAEDTKPAELPKTGLAESAYFYCAGLFLIVGGAMVLLKKKQKEA